MVWTPSLVSYRPEISCATRTRNFDARQELTVVGLRGLLSGQPAEVSGYAR